MQFKEAAALVADKHRQVREALDQLSKVVTIINNRTISEVNQQLNSNSNLARIIEVGEAAEGVDRELDSALLRVTITIIITTTTTTTTTTTMVIEEAETKAIDRQILRLIKLRVNSRCSLLASGRPSGVTNSSRRALQINQGVVAAASFSSSNTKIKAPNSLQVNLVLQ